MPRSKERLRSEARRGSSPNPSIDLYSTFESTRGNLPYTAYTVCIPGCTGRTPPTCHNLCSFMAPVPSRAAIFRLINASQHTSCPCHGSHVSHNAYAIANQLRRLAIPVDKVEKEYAFEVFCAFLALHSHNCNLGLGCCIQSSLWRRCHP